jgi:SAM-dependent methyltransferase
MTTHFNSIRHTAYLLAVAASLTSAAAVAQPAAVAQQRPKLDVIFVPTPQDVVDRMLQMAEVKPTDFVIDLGCGDGRMVITAAQKYGARGYGVDIDPDRINDSNENAKRAGVTDKVAFKVADLFQEDIKKANVMTMYLLRDINLRLRPKILDELQPGSRIVSHAFDMGDWEPDQRDNVNDRNIYFWYVPAKVQGKWLVEDGEQKFTLELDQKYQMVSGKANSGGKSVDVSGGRLKGTELSFTVDLGGKKQDYKGRVDGDQITAINGNWKARRG